MTAPWELGSSLGVSLQRMIDAYGDEVAGYLVVDGMVLVLPADAVVAALEKFGGGYQGLIDSLRERYE